MSRVLTHSTEIDSQLGFRYRTIYIYNENSSLHTHDYYEIFLTLADSVEHFINDEHQMLDKGSLVFIRKNDRHFYLGTKSENASFINLAFTEQILKDLLSYLSEGFCSEKLLNSKMPPTVLLQNVDIDWMIKQMELLNSTPSTSINILKYRSRVLLFKIFTRYFSKICLSTSDETDAPEWLKKLDHEMHKLSNFSKDGNHMVKMSGKCRAYLGRMLKIYYKKTIPEYINDLRLNYWSNSLVNSDASILDICFECGFENVSWAYSLFKKRYGVSPMKYRKTSK